MNVERRKGSIMLVFVGIISHIDARTRDCVEGVSSFIVA